MTMSATSEPDARASADVSRTQEAILAAYAELIEELGTDDVSFRLIARRAGVGERTIFRNYPTRVDLLLATAAWIESEIFPRQDSPSIFDMPLTIRAAMESYDRRPELAHVVAETTMRGVSGAAPSPRRGAFVAFPGETDGSVSFQAVIASAAVCFALTPQLAEQIDVIRAMPPRTRVNQRAWWASLLFAGPGWVLFSGIKQVVGVFLAVYLITRVDPSLGQQAAEPVRQFIALYESIMPEWLAIALALVLVVVAQVKINVTNAYSGSLAWSNVYTRLTKTYPGRSVFIFFNLGIALALMWMDVFSLISFVLSLYANVVMAWLVTIAADIAINKHVLRISPIYPEFRRGMLRDWNPVGLTSVGLASLLSLAAFGGAFGEDVRPFSVLIAIGVAVVVTPLMALVTRGKYYLRRQTDGIASAILDADGNPSGERLRCHVTGYTFERPDMLASAERGTYGETQYVSSLALTLDDSDRYVLPAEPMARRTRSPGRTADGSGRPKGRGG